MRNIHALFAASLVLLSTGTSIAEVKEAPGGPGIASTYQSGGKEGFGTSISNASRVWFTLTKGMVSEVYYGLISNPMIRGIEFAVSDGKNFVDLESLDMTSRVSLADSRALCYDVVSSHPDRGYTLRKRIFTDPAGQALIVKVRFDRFREDHQLYVMVDPMGNGSGDRDTGVVVDGAFVLMDTDCMVVTTEGGFQEATVGFRGVNDGAAQLGRYLRLENIHSEAYGGNIAFAGRLDISGLAAEWTLVAGFGSDENEARAAADAVRGRELDQIEREYISGWNEYCAAITPPPEEDPLYYSSAMVLRACEDKANPGAFIASPSMGWGDIGGPWGDFRGDTNDQYYFKIWSRDLYQTATALAEIGDTASAMRALVFLDEKQQLPDGSFPQNSDVTGRMFWRTIQMDQVACPILLAHRLFSLGALTADRCWKSLIRPAAEYIVEHGPFTRNERWENREGYSPASIASQIAGLFCAADFADHNGDETVAFRYREVASRWDRSLDLWTYTFRANRFDTAGHYVRIDPNGVPNENSTNDEDIDISYLETVRLGVRKPDDPLVRNTMRTCDANLAKDVRGRRGWLRFTGDDYGEMRKGRIWPLLSGERGHAEIALGKSARNEIEAMREFSNGIIFPEQVWDEGEEAGRATGSCAPLAWAHAEYIKLVLSESHGRIVDMPAPMFERLKGAPVHALHLFPSSMQKSSAGETVGIRFHVITDRAMEPLDVRLDGVPVASDCLNDELLVKLPYATKDSILSVWDTAGRMLFEARPIADAKAAAERNRIRYLAVAGSFNSWNTTDPSTVMVLDTDGVYRLRLHLSPGNYEYKYAANGRWEINYGGEAEKIWQDGPNFRLHVAEEGDYLFTLKESSGQQVIRGQHTDFP